MLLKDSSPLADIGLFGKRRYVAAQMALRIGPDMLRKIAKGFAGLIVVLVMIVGCQQVRNSGSDTLPETAPQALRLATYNVHYIILGRETGPWSVGDWERRKGPLDLAFKAVDADVMAFQEMESFGGGSEGDINLTLDWLLANNPGYAAAAVGPAATFPSTQPILYRSDRLALLDQGWFFFSETPDVIYARTFNGSYPAFASWAQFRDLTSGAEFRVVNLHTDYASLSNREQSIALVAERIAPWIGAEETVFVTGDFNARLGSPILQILGDLGVEYAPVQGSTFHFNRGINLFGAIDHIGYVGGPALVAGPFVVRDQFAGEWPTDHYPVAADFTLSAP